MTSLREETLNCNNRDSKLRRCNFCGALCSARARDRSCTNDPIHVLDIPCEQVLERLADPDCATCGGRGIAYRFEDMDSIEGYKMASRKACLKCIRTKKPTSKGD